MAMNTEPSNPREQKNYSQNAAVVFHRGFFMSWDIQDSPMIFKFQTATIIGLRHDTYLKHTDCSYMACTVEEKFFSTFSISSNHLFVEGTWKGRSGEFLNFGYSS
jgi:hypothetical protein